MDEEKCTYFRKGEDLYFYPWYVKLIESENKRLREALKQIIINAQRKGHDDFTPVYLAKQALGE